MTESEKQTLAFRALGLLEEQVQARIVHYKAELETSPELDAVTAQVVAQLKAMQATLGGEDAARLPPEVREQKQITTFARLLEKLLDPARQSSFHTQSLKAVGKRIAKLFFESELHEKTKGDKEKTVHHAEQGVHYVLQRYKNRLRAELDGFEYDSPEVKHQTLNLLAKVERDLQVAFLSRRSPELNRVMTVFSNVLMEFLGEHLPPRCAALARNTIRAAGTAHQPNSVAYKVLSDGFASFRAEWERQLMEQMVHFCGDQLMERLTEASQEFREETIKFFTDPHIFSETCQVLCEGVYDFLCNEGFLDLPVNWRVSLAPSLDA
jgi:hypothetical protein